MPPYDPIAYFAKTNARRLPHRTFGIKQSDRMHHMYLIGRTGVGKSTLLETLALQDIHAGHGIALIDPHGDLVRRLAGKIPKERLGDVVYLNAPDPTQPYGYNPLRKVRPDKVGLAVGGLLDALKQLWSDSWGVRMEHILRKLYGSSMGSGLAFCLLLA